MHWMRNARSFRPSRSSVRRCGAGWVSPSPAPASAPPAGRPPRRSSAAPAPGRGLAASHSMSLSTVTPSRSAARPSSSSRSALGGSPANTGRSSSTAASLPSALSRSPSASSRSTRKRTNGTDASTRSRHRRGALRAATSSAGSRPAGSETTRSSSLPPRGDPRGAQHRLLPGAVGVERQQHDRREPRELADLLLGQRRAHQADGVAHPGLVQRDHVGVALAQDDAAACARRVRPREVGAEELPTLVVDRSFSTC